MAHLGDKLKELRKTKAWNQVQMAHFLGIGERTYQTIEKTGVIKKTEDIKKIKLKTGIDAQKIAFQPNATASNLPGDQELPYKGGITLNDHIAEIKSNNEYLKAMLAFSLNDLSKNQKDMYAHLKGAIKRQAERYSKMDQEKMRAELHTISTYAAEIRLVDEKEDNQHR